MKRLLIALLILGIGVSAICFVSASKQKPVKGWIPFYTTEAGEVFEYHSGMVQKSNSGLQRVWVRSSGGCLVFLELRDDWTYRIIEGNEDNEDNENIGKLKNIHPDSPQEKLVQLLF